MAHRILIVDDAAFMRMMIKDILIKKWFSGGWGGSGWSSGDRKV